MWILPNLVDVTHPPPPGHLRGARYAIRAEDATANNKNKKKPTTRSKNNKDNKANKDNMDNTKSAL